MTKGYNPGGPGKPGGVRAHSGGGAPAAARPAPIRAQHLAEVSRRLAFRGARPQRPRCYWATTVRMPLPSSKLSVSPIGGLVKSVPLQVP